MHCVAFRRGVKSGDMSFFRDALPANHWENLRGSMYCLEPTANGASVSTAPSSARPPAGRLALINHSLRTWLATSSITPVSTVSSKRGP